MTSFLSRPFGGMPSAQFAQIANLMSPDSHVVPARAAALPLAIQAQTSMPNANDIYAKRKARRVEVQHEDYGEPPSATRNIMTAYDAKCLYARREQARTEWTDKQIQFA